MKFSYNTITKLVTSAALILGAVSVPAFANSVDITGLWRFNNASGPVIDNIGITNGVVGYVDQNYEGTAVRQRGRIVFEGKPNSIVLIDDDTIGQFDATKGTTYFRYKARLKLPRNLTTTLNDDGDLIFPSRATWNVVQKGRSGNPGGQWKMQIIERNGQAYLQCVIQDGVNGQIDATAWGQPFEFNKIHYATCVVDRRKNLLKAIIENEEDNGKPFRNNPTATATNANGVVIADERRRGVMPAGFGDIAPMSGACGASNPYGQTVSIGNKPVCPGSDFDKLDSSDQFVGKIYQIKVEKQ